MIKKLAYEPPFLEELRLSCGLHLLDTLSTEGDVNDWIQETPIDIIEEE